MGRSWKYMGMFLLGFAVAPTVAQDMGREIYMQRCYWCHGEEGKGDGPSAVGMFPRPRDLVRADYMIRSTPHGQLPTDEDLFRVITGGLAGTPMPAWGQVLTEDDRRQLVSYIKTLSPRFATETPKPISIPTSTGSAEHGEEIFRVARCFVCHGETGRGDGQVTVVLNYQWGLPHSARDFTRGWTFKGGHEPADIYLRITGGLNGTPMGSYRELLTDQERWDLAHYVASLDEEPSETSDDFVLTAAYVNGEIPDDPIAGDWQRAQPIWVALAGQVVIDPPLRWWTPTVGTTMVRALWNGSDIGFLLEWNDPTGPDSEFPDAAMLQFAAHEGQKPYFLSGDTDSPVVVWQWQTHDLVEVWRARGEGSIDSQVARIQTHSNWNQGRWQVVLRRSLGDAPKFSTDTFVPILLSLRDGANAEIGNVRAVSTWLYATLQPPRSPRPWLSAFVWLLGAMIAELWIVERVRS